MPDVAPPLERRKSGSLGPFQKAMGVFKEFDSNGDGTIDRVELRLLLQMLDSKWSDDRADAVFEAIDSNKDGRIQFEELLLWTFQGQGEEQPAFRQVTALDQEIKSFVTVEVHNRKGEVVYGPEEHMGSLIVSILRRKVRSKAGVPVGCLRHGGEQILRDSMELGVYAEGSTMELELVEDVFSLLPRACAKQLRELGVMQNFEGQTCLRLGTSKPAVDSTGRKGFDDKELMFLADGRFMVKELRFRVRRDAAAGTTERTWHYGMAEGSFSLLDPSTCHVEVSWRAWAEASGQDEEGSVSVDEVLQPWEAHMADEDNPQEPRHLLPSKANQVNLLHVAKEWADPVRSPSGGKRFAEPRDSIAIPCVDEGVLIEVEMDTRNLTYWQFGKDVAGRHLAGA